MKKVQNEIQPFKILHYRGGETYSVILEQDNYWYDWVQEVKIKSSKYGDGHCYDDAFREYLIKKYYNLHERLNYDSENGMFCVYCKNRKDANEVAQKLSDLYKDEEKMINLIKYVKQKYNYQFDIDIKI